MELKNKHLEKYLNFAVKLVKNSNDITLKYYQKKLKHKVKDNNSPVTMADLNCEKFMSFKIKTRYPEHSILGEEGGESGSGSEFKWIIDPVDGTKNFMRKYPYWGTMLALEYMGEIILGVISMPALKDFVYAAKGMGCYYNDKKAKVSKIKLLKDSYLIHGGIDYISTESYKDNFLNLSRACYYSRGFGDCHGHAFIIKGKAEIMVDPHVSPWDVAPVKICVEESGGMFTDLSGKKSIYSGNALVTNGKVHEAALKMLNMNLESRDITRTE